jgi:hypothetical protein
MARMTFDPASLRVPKDAWANYAIIAAALLEHHDAFVFDPAKQQWYWENDDADRFHFTDLTECVLDWAMSGGLYVREALVNLSREI